MIDNRVKYRWDIMAAGIGHNDRHKAVEQYVREGEDCLLVREVDHPRDKHAVQIHTLNGHMVGYVPKEHAEKLSRCLDDGCHLYNAYFSRVLEQGKFPIPCVRINVYLSSAQLDDRILHKHTVVKHKQPRKQQSGREKKGLSWITWLVLIFILWWWQS